jgi:hypothetical protein
VSYRIASLTTEGGFPELASDGEATLGSEVFIGPLGDAYASEEERSAKYTLPLIISMRWGCYKALTGI